MEGKTCCVTGHRDLPQKEINHFSKCYLILKQATLTV